ncbi:MAG: hypothetical protein JXR03_18565 [Cyclobacteriaceae bacterium]
MKSLAGVFFVFLIVFSCKTAEKKMTLEEVKKRLITELNDQVSCQSNGSNTFELCQTDLNDSQVDDLRKFLVIDKKSDKVVFEKSVSGGYVKWIDDSKIEFYSVPGIMKEGQSKSDFVKIYDLQSNKIIKKTDSSESSM